VGTADIALVGEILRSSDDESSDGHAWRRAASALVATPAVAFIGYHLVRRFGAIFLIVGVGSQIVAPLFAVAAAVSAFRAWKRQAPAVDRSTAAVISLAGSVGWIVLLGTALSGLGS
jgi:hypothetical protein